MTQRVSTGVPVTAKSNQRLAILLAMAMFVLVVDTSLMNVSISAVVDDLDTTVTGVQSAIALEALVSAASSSSAARSAISSVASGPTCPSPFRWRCSSPSSPASSGCSTRSA
jgi:hypothetical protein